MFASSPSRERGGGGGSFSHSLARQPGLVYMVGLLLVLALAAWWFSAALQPHNQHAHQRSYNAAARTNRAGGAGTAGPHTTARGKLNAMSQQGKQGSAAVVEEDAEEESGPSTCAWQFSHYAPSSWELDWSSSIAMVQNRTGRSICAKLREDPSKAVGMVESILSWHAAPSTPASMAAANKTGGGADLMSRMHYNLACSSSSSSEGGAVVATGFQLVEPLIGMLRDPLAMCPGGPLPGQSERVLDPPGFNGVQSKRFLLPMLFAPYELTVAKDAPRGLQAALADVAKNTGLAPWAYHGPRPRHDATAAATDDAASSVVAASSALQAKAEKPQKPWRFYAKPASNPVEEVRETALVLSGAADQVVVPAGLASMLSLSERSRASPRILLFDMGASYFGDWNLVSSAQGSSHFYNAMATRGIRFDHVWAYEYEVLDPRKEWASIPADLYADFTFVNSGVLGDPASHANPWNTLLQQARPSDYVIVKLDIDTPEIEMALMQQLMEEPALQDRIDELYFEHHVLVNEMINYWGTDPVKLPQRMSDSYEMFTKLRNMGIRMHSWP